MNLSTIRWGATNMRKIPLTHDIENMTTSTANIAEGSMQLTTMTPLKMVIEHLLRTFQIMMAMKPH
jgi:hypothetical protein